jgi:hypothetical protein
VGYSTDFTGEVTVTPPLSAQEADFLQRFAVTRHCSHQPSMYAAAPRLSRAEIAELSRPAVTHMTSDCPAPRNTSCGGASAGALVPVGAGRL